MDTKRPITEKDLEKSLGFIMEDEYRRKRMLAMLHHMAMWHMLGNEQEVASWLLWERQSMMVHEVDSLASIDVMKNNIMVQLMMNGFSLMKQVEDSYILHFQSKAFMVKVWDYSSTIASSWH